MFEYLLVCLALIWLNTLLCVTTLLRCESIVSICIRLSTAVVHQ